MQEVVLFILSFLFILVIYEIFIVAKAKKNEKKKKESDFFNVIGDIKKQTIIVTKSFLTDNKDGSSSINMEQIKDLQQGHISDEEINENAVTIIKSSSAVEDIMCFKR